MFKSLAILLAVALVATANQDYKSNRMKLLTQTVSARLHGEAIPSDQPQFKAVSRTKNLQASIPQGSQLQFQPQQSFQQQQQPQFVSQQFGTQMPVSQPQFSVPQQAQQFTPQFQAPTTQQRAPSPIEQAQLQQQLQKQQQIQQQQQQINAQKAVQDQQVLQQQQQLIQQQQQQQHVSVPQPQQPIVPQQQFVVSPDASAISGAQAPISPLQQQQLMQQQQQQQMINSQQQSQIPQLQQQQAAQLQQQIQQQRVPQQPQQFVPQQPLAQQPQQIVPQQQQQFVPQQQQQFVPQQQQQFVPQQQQQFVPQQQPISSSGLAQTCSTAQPGDLVAHPSSPSSFIICYGFGEFTVMDCPEHLVFNAHTQRCDLTTDVPMGCASNPCANNGRCTDLALGQFRCDCPIGFAGMQCERVDACSANTCGGDGVCIALPAGSPVPNACMCNGGRSIGASCASAEANPCIQPNSNLRLFSVNFNPSLFAHCEGARPNFMFCQAPLIFNAAKQSCDWPSRK